MKPNGKIKTVKADFNIRHGVTQKPLADIEFVGKLEACKCMDQVKAWLGP